MPALPNVPGVLAVDFDFSVGQDLLAKVKRHYTYTGGPPSVADCNTIATDFLSLVSAFLLAMMHPSRSIEYVTVTDLTSPTSHQGANANHQVGTRTGADLGASVCLLENLVIGRRYRGGKPRSYWPFGTDTDLAASQVWSNTFQGLVAAALSLYDAGALAITSGSTNIAAPCSVSYYQGFTPVTNPITGRTRDVPTLRAGPLTPDIITSTRISPNLASQRRRNLQRS
jgi:hypothetical protein